MTYYPGKAVVEKILKKAAEERARAEEADARDPGRAVDCPDPGHYAADVLERLAKEFATW